MPAKIIDGKKIADEILDDVKKKVEKSKTKPGLALVLVGDNPASQIYVNSKEKKCREVGIYVERHNLPKEISEAKLLELLEKLNQRKEIHGILVQLPLPKHIDENLITNAILAHKDVDGFTSASLGNLVSEKTGMAPATAIASVYLVESTGTKIEGKNAVIIGRSRIVGKPAALLLLEKNATVTICHSKTKGLKEHTKKADIIIAAVGKPKLVTKDMVKEGAIVIDVGINRVNEQIVGDVDFENVRDVAGFITPVPGGVGPMTIAMLIKNTLRAKEIAEQS